MPELKNLCAHIPLELYSKVSAAKTVADQTISEYVTQLLTEYYNWKENGGTIMTQNSEKTRTLAFQISENLFRRIKSYLERETERTGVRLTQRDFVIGLIETALAADESVDNGENSDENSDEDNGGESPAFPEEV